MQLRRILGALVFLAAAAIPASANITSTSLRIEGAGLAVLNDPPVTTGIDLPVTIQTSFGNRTNDEATSIEGLLAVGELTGPGLETPIQLTTAPGHKFQIPGLPQKGDYFLQNIRLMKGTEFLQYATPATTRIIVADLLQTKITVKQLSAADLRARGIIVDARNFDVYEFSFTFIIDGKPVVIPFPVIIDPRTHEVQPVRGESEYMLPREGLIEPPRWTPPQVIPLDFGEEGELPEPGKEPKERAPQAGRPSMPAAIVIPNSMAVLHQFFAVALMVTNGAPETSAARLENIRATMRVSDPGALRTVKTLPQVSFGQPVPVVADSGTTFLVAQARGEAEWTLEGLRPGSHRIDFDLRATLKQQGQDDILLRATPSAAIVIHDPRFNVTFSHPDVVRKGIEYSTYAFITNLSEAQREVIVTSAVPSCDNAAEDANVCRLNGGVTDLMTIPGGGMRLIEYRLRPGVTGQVFATAGTLSDTDVLSANVKLHMGVSPEGIPLSPATLILPYYAQFVSPAVVSANLELFGLGYSLATAPLGPVTAALPRVIKTDVYTRAVDLSRSGQRNFITNDAAETKRDSIVHLSLDLLGNSGYELREWDALRRRVESGRKAGASVMRELEATALAAPGVTMTSFMDDFARVTAHRRGYAAILAHGSGTGDRPYAITLNGASTDRETSLHNESAAKTWKRDLPYADISAFNGAGEKGELALVGRWTEDLEVAVTPAADGPYVVDVIYPYSADGKLYRARFNLTGVAGAKVLIPLTRGASTASALFPIGGVAAVGSVTLVEPDALRILGARQDLHLDKDGHKVSMLFNRPVKAGEGVDLRTKFTGEIDFNQDSVVYKAARPISAAALQEDGRTVNLTFDHTLSANATYKIEVGSLVDGASGAPVSFPGTIAPKIDNDLSAGIIYGKVVKGDGTPIKGVDVVIRQYLPNDSSADPKGTPQFDVSQADGAFLYEFVRRQIDLDWKGTYRLEALSSVHGHTGIEGAVRLPGKVHFVSLQYLGRGAAQGRVTYNDGSVVKKAKVVIGSTMFNQFRSAETDDEGKYSIEDLPVGPLTFSAQDEAGNVTFAAAEIATPGQIVTQNLSIFRAAFPGTGRVYGVVRRSDTNAPVPHAHVGIYSQGYGLSDTHTDSEGRFDFQKVPAGFVTLLGAEYSVAPESIAIDFDLKADEVKQQDVLLFVAQPTMKLVTLKGIVSREKVSAPGTYERAAGALVKISGYKIVTADANGEFTYENLPSVFSEKSITAYDPVTQRVKTVTLPTMNAEGTYNVAISIAAFDRGSGTIRVRLLNAAGRPVSGYRLIEPGFPPDELHEVGNGVYEMRNASVGVTHNIRAVAGGMRPDNGQPDPRPYGDQAASGQVAVAFNGHIAALTLRLPGQGTVKVKVRSQFDLISDVDLTYSVWDEGEQHMVPLTLRETTNKLGEPDYAVFEKIPALNGYGVASAHPQYGYAGKGATLAYDGDLDEHILQLNTLAKVSGTVYAIDGLTPIAGATVRINNGRSDPGPQLSGPDGRFEFFDQPSAVTVTVTAEFTQNGVYRIGIASATTPNNGGVVDNMAVMLRKRGFVDGKVVYKNYKKFDPNNVANNIPDDTPNDYSDNAPVPLAKFHLRELDFPARNFGTAGSPLTADVGGRFLINNVFIGALRATAWDAGNEEVRGSWAGSIDEEGAEAAPKAYIAVGDAGVGSLEVVVVDPNQAYLEIANADVGLYAGRPWDFSTTGATGKAVFDEIPVGTYSVSAYSRSVGKTSKSETVVITRDHITQARLELEFSGTVDGTLTDPEEGNSPVPGSHVRLTASNYQTLSTTDVLGKFTFLGVREGTFRLDAKDTDTNRRASAERTLSVADPHRTVNLQLEPLETLHFAAYLPNDTGGNSGILAPPQRVEVIQRCYTGLDHVRHCDFERQLQGNPIQFPGVFENSGYGIGIFKPGEVKADVNLGGAFPTGKAATPFVYVYPAFGDVNVHVTQGGAPAVGAFVTIYSQGKSVNVYTDAAGNATARGLRLGGITVSAKSIDERFTGSTTVQLLRQSVAAEANIALGTYAGVTGRVLAEVGGGAVSVGTRVIAHYSGFAGEARTDDEGRYTFLGIPTPATGTTRVNLTFVGPDDNTLGGFAFKDVKAGDGVLTVGDVRLDATPPTLDAILPAENSVDVSPDTNVRITFSEAINPGTITAQTFQLIASDGSGTVTCALTHGVVDGKFVVIMTPAKPPTGFPLKSNTLYRVVVTNGVHDLTGHPLGATLGFGFTTSDYAEPRVLKALPVSPIPPSTTFEFRFNEPIAPAPWQQGGNGEFHVYKLAAPGGAAAAIEREMVAHTFLDANNIILYVALDDAADNRIQPESFYRVTFKGVKDPQGNAAVDQVHHFYSYDEVKPFVVISTPAEGQQLVSGAEYEVTLDLRNGSASGTQATDVKEVRWYTIDAQNKAVRFATVTLPPYSVKIAPQAPASGATFTIAAEAFDTSGNISTMERRTWTVKPNEAPKNVVVTPVQAAAYPSMPVSAKVTFEDEGSFVSMLVTFSTPKSDGTTDTQNFPRTFFRTPAGSWPEALFTYTIPANARGGEAVTVTAVVSDAPGLQAPPATATIGVSLDTVQPQILLVSPPPGTTFVNTTKYVIEATVKDAETGVQSVTFFVDATAFATASSEKLANGMQKFRSVQVETKSKADDANIPIVVTAKDYNGNTKSTTFDVRYMGVNDPDAPKVTWLCPTDGAALPSNAAAFALKLRLRVIDQDVRTVQFVIGSQTINGAVTGTNEYGATHTFTTPAAGALAISAIVEDTVATHKVELPITLDVIDADYIIKDPLPITATDAAQYTGKTIALIGTGAQLLPQVPLTLANLMVLNGARVETLPTDIVREFRLNITTTGVTYVDCDSNIDVTDKGYVGGWRNTAEGQNASLRGRTVGNTTTGGADHCSQASHAGLGGIATCGQTNAPYGSIAEPVDLGSGGGGSATCCNTGASGGGVIALRGGNGETDKSRIVIGGKVRADGQHGYIGGTQHAGGSGGSIRIDAKHLLLSPNAVVSANGGDDDGSNPGSWGAGGGRVSIGATTRLDLSTAVVEARGGRDWNQPEVRTVMDGGAGTVLIRKPGQEHGELTVSSLDLRFPASVHTVRPTPLGRIGKGTSTALAANALTDASRTFDRWMVGEHVVLGGDTTRPYTVVAISADGKTLQTDPADGSMLAAAGSQSVAYAGLLVFDKITAGKRAVLVFDEHVSTAGAVDDKSVMLVDPTAAVLLAVEPQTLTLTSKPAEGGNIIRDTPLSVTYTAAATGGVARVQFAWSPTAPTPGVHDYHDVPSPTPSRTFTLPVPPATPLGEATLVVTVTDRVGRSTTFPARTYQIVTNAEPVIASYTIAPGLSIHAGRDVVATVNATDDISVKTISFEAKLNGVSVKTQSASPNTATASSTFTVPLAVDVAGGSTLQIDVTVSDGFAGRTPLQASQTVTILPDTIAPQITITSPAAGASYRESVDKVPVRITAVDAEVKTKEAFAQLEGGSIIPLTLVANTNDWRADILAPPVDSETPIQRTLVVTAKDYAGNTRVSEPVALTFTPLVASGAPALAWSCATQGAVFPAGAAVKLRVSATEVRPPDDPNTPNPVQSVEMYVGDSQTSLTVTAVPNTPFYDATYTIPAGTPEGTVFSVRAIARSAGGPASDLLTSFSAIVADATISSSMTIEAITNTYDNKTVVITGGTVTIRGPHTFDRLIVIGGSVVHAALEKLELTTTRGIYVGCDGFIDASGQGYGSVTTYPGESGPTDGNTGGSHIGKGGVWGTPGSTYGSIYQPQEHGAGGNDVRGGGVVKLTAATLHVDGKVRANGIDRSGGAAAGGSVWIIAGRLSGAGSIEALGGRNSQCCNYGGGGGGALAIEYTDPATKLPKLLAYGPSSNRTGGAGSIWVKGPSSVYGDLTVDNNGATSTVGVTELPSLGKGTALAGTIGATLVTDRPSNIQPYFAKHWVEITTAAGAPKGTWRVAMVTPNSKTVTLAPNGTETISLEPGDKWQGVYIFDAVIAGNGAKLVSNDPFRGTTLDLSGSNVELQTALKADTVTVRGTVAASSITAKNLTVETGATLKQVFFAGSVTLDVAETLTVRGTIDVSAQGYGSVTTYPGESGPTDGNTGGSHIGRGGVWGTPGSTYGSVYRPQENGAGGNDVRGGGVVKITAGTLLVDGSIRANGEDRSGGAAAGGSIWITAGRITGTGTIEANGGRNTQCCNYGGGGGGAVSIAYTDANSSLPTLRATAQSSNRNGGAGSVYVKGAGQAYGNLTIDNSNLTQLVSMTELPSLGSGVAQTGTSGATLVTNRGANVPAYFAGHWVEITGAGGTLKGTWRIATVPPNSKTVTLEPNGSETLALEPGDAWQGVYRFDSVFIRNAAKLHSPDPIRAVNLDFSGANLDLSRPIFAETATVRGTISAPAITVKELTVETGGVLKQYAAAGSLTLNVQNTLTVRGAIDVSAQGYGSVQTYPGESGPTDGNTGGSHIGKGGLWGTPGSTYGSVYRPQENGAGGNDVRGGGVLKVNAGAVAVDGAIRANGEDRSGGAGAGGSIWIVTGRISGTGTIEANGGRNTQCCNYGGGGGGAVAIEYTDPASVLPVLRATAQFSNRNGGAGSVYVKRAGQTYGDLTVDNSDITQTVSLTELPSLGSGVAQAGTSGATLVTNRGANIQPYFAGHWVEITSATGTVKGQWRIATVPPNSKTVTLEPNAGETLALEAGDLWQGVYLFDLITMRNAARVTSIDPIRGTGLDFSGANVELWKPVVISGPVTVRGIASSAGITAADMTVDAAGVLKQFPAMPLPIKLQNTLTVLGSIDVTGLGYSTRETYPGETPSNDANTGGSHIGKGGEWGSIGTTYGSIYRPQEMGAGGNDVRGGGAVKIEAATIVVNGSIRANGAERSGGAGAGGSVWIRGTKITGTGTIEANGGRNTQCCNYGGGGGGAVSVEYTDPASVVPVMSAKAISSRNNGGAGSVYVKGATATYGNLVVDADNIVGQATQLPSIGNGAALAGTSGATVVTDAPANFQPYFAGHWIDVDAPSGTRKGTWRIASVTGKSFTLAPNTAGETIDVQPGDNWRGVYLFDNVTLRNRATVQLLDALRGSKTIDSTSSLTANDPPVVNPGLINVESSPAGDFIVGTIGAVQDLHHPIVVTITSVRTGLAYPAFNAGTDGSFRYAVTGEVGDTFTIRARDSFSLTATSRVYPVTGAILATNGIESFTVTPYSVIGGGTATGTIRMRHPVRRAAEGVLTLLSSHAQATIPATVTIPVGASVGSFTITTSAVSQDTSVQVTASNALMASVAANFDILAGTSALTDLQLAQSSVEGGTSVNATAFIAAPSFDGVVYLTSSDTRLATVPDHVFIASGATSVTFTVTTYGVAAAGSVQITASHGGSKISRPLSLTKCTALGSVAAPTAPSLGTVWIDDTLPTGATQTGDGVLDATQFATGSSSIHLSGAAAGTRTFAFTGGAALAVAPTDSLVFYALVNPCNPARELVVSWKAGTTEYTGAWGESRIAQSATVLAYPRTGALPRAGQWTRIEVPAKSLGITAAASITGFSVRAADGEAWIDSVGRSTCTSPNAPAPEFQAGEQVWFDDELPAGAVVGATTSAVTPWQWSTDQVASGARSHVQTVRSGTHEHYFTGATETLVTGNGDVLFAYVFLDPCNPPRQLMLEWYDGSWDHKAYWGDNLVPTNLIGPIRTRMGPMPEAGKWVRLEVPVGAVNLKSNSINGIAFVIYDGQAWFDRPGKLARVNLALNKPASQSSNYSDASGTYVAGKAVDGNLHSPAGASITGNQNRPWWQVDLGDVYPIDVIDILGRTDCCHSQSSSVWLSVSDTPFTSTDVETTFAQPGVSTYAFPGTVGELASFAINRTGRYVRIHGSRFDHLTLPEVQVWAPIAPVRVNHAGGLRLGATAINMWDGNAHPAYGVNGSANYGHAVGGSLYHTQSGGWADPWYDMDLGAVMPIGSVDIWPRIDCCPEQSQSLWVFVSDAPFDSKSFATTFAQTGVSSWFHGPYNTSMISFPVNRTGRYVRVARSGTSTSLQFAEVQVWSQQAVLPAFSRKQESPPER